MEKLTSKYETVFIVNATLPEEEIQATVEKFRALVEANATIEKVLKNGDMNKFIAEANEQALSGKAQEISAQ